MALGDMLVVSLATAKRLPSAKDSLLDLDARTSKAFFDRHMLVCIDSYGISTTPRSNNRSLDVSFWADAGLEGIVNQKQHQPSRPGGPAAPIQNGSESASTYSVEQQALQPPSLQFVSLQQDKDNSNIAAEVVPFYSGMDLN